MGAPGYTGPTINLADEAEVHFECETCHELCHEDDLRFARDLELCVDCFIERGEK